MVSDSKEATKIIIPNSTYIFIGGWDIPVGTKLRFYQMKDQKIPDYVGNDYHAMSIDYQGQQRFVTYTSLDIQPDFMPQCYIIRTILK